MLGSPCVAEASVHRICRPCKPMTALPCCMQDLGFFCCVCRFTFFETLFQIDLGTMVAVCFWVTFRSHSLAHREESEKRTTASPSHQHRTLPHYHHQDERRYYFYSRIAFADHAFQVVGRTFNFGGLWLKCFALVQLSRTSTRMEQSTAVPRAHASTGSPGSSGNRAAWVTEMHMLRSVATRDKKCKQARAIWWVTEATVHGESTHNAFHSGEEQAATFITSF